MRAAPAFAAMAVGIALTAVACGSCTPPGPQPSPPGPQPPPITDGVVYQELVTAQCLAPSEGGLEAVAEEHKGDRQPPWLACLYDGGTVSSCGVPCE